MTAKNTKKDQQTASRDVGKVLDDVLGRLRNLEKNTLEILFLSKKIDKLELQTENAGQTDTVDKWLSVDGLVSYIPNHPTKQTIYSWMRDNKIPYYKGEKHCYFKRSEIDEWMAKKPNLTQSEIQNLAKEYIKNNPKNK